MSDIEIEKRVGSPPGELENGTMPETVDKMTERKLMAKLDRRIIPMIMWLYLMNFMDRVAIGNARLYGMEEDLGLVGSQYQISVSVLFITYCLFETPSNMVIKRLQPARYLTGLCFCWGVVATFTAFVNNFASLVACRLLLGLFEAGMFPGIMLYLTMFYNRKNIALRTAYFFATAAVSGAVGGLVAYGVGFMDGTAGWRAWRWVLLLVGLPTIATAFVVPFVLPNSAESAKFLTDEDKRNLVLLREVEVGQTKSAQELHWDDVKHGMRDWTTYAFAACQYCSNTMLYSFSVFLPTIISQIGTWSRAESQALTIPVYSLGALTYVCMGRISDVTQQRGIFAIGGTCVALLGYALLIANKGSGLSFAGCFLVATGCYTAVGSPLAWLASNNPRYGKRAFASGMQLTIGNSAGVAAPFLFSNVTAPTYYPGYGVTMGLLCVSTSLFTILHFHWRRQNKRRAAGLEDWKADGKTEQEVAEMGDKSPRFMAMI